MQALSFAFKSSKNLVFSTQSSQQKTAPEVGNIILAGTPIRSDSVKYLGVKVDNRLRSENHIKHKVSNKPPETSSS